MLCVFYLNKQNACYLECFQLEKKQFQPKQLEMYILLRAHYLKRNFAKLENITHRTTRMARDFSNFWCRTVKGAGPNLEWKEPPSRIGDGGWEAHSNLEWKTF